MSSTSAADGKRGEGKGRAGLSDSDRFGSRELSAVNNRFRGGILAGKARKKIKKNR